MDEKVKSMGDLAARLNQYAYAYYTMDNPLISDAQYDALYQQLQDLEKETGIILPESPTQRIGDRVLPGFQKHTHRATLWSLDKVKSAAEFVEWETRNRRLLTAETGREPEPFEYVVTMKFDGLTISLTYEGGRLVHGATRGTGQIGEEILPQLMTIPSLPPIIDAPGTAELRGEAIMTMEAFETYNATAKVPLKNLRNGAAGALRNLDINETRRRGLSAFFYDINYWEGEAFPTYTAELDYLEGQGFPVHSFRRLCKGSPSVLEAVAEIEKTRDALNFDIDGAVIAINDLSLRRALGYTVKSPRWAVAFKFEAMEETTRLLAVEWNVGRTGKVTPTAILEPIQLGGVTVSRATLNNIDDIRRKNLKQGQKVFIRRSNDVIPEILGSAGPEDGEEGSDGLGEAAPEVEIREIETPTHCPECHAELVRDGVHLFCPDAIGCKPQMVKAMVHFASREAMNIEGFSEKTAQQLFDVLDFRSVDQLYTLTKQDVLGLAKFKDKKADKLLQAIEKSKDCTLAAFVFALGIPNVGKKTAQDLAEAFGSLDTLQAADRESLLAVSEVGEIVASSIEHFFRDPKVAEVIRNLLQAGVRPIPQTRRAALTQQGPFYGKNVVVTGTLEKYSRTEIQTLLTELGADPRDSVSSTTDYVIAGENAGSKLTKALAMREAGAGKPVILSEAEFETLRQTRQE